MEALRNLIVGKTGGRTAQIHRAEVERVGKDLGMVPEEACRQFFALRGTVWGVATGSMVESTVRSEESDALAPPRNWLAIADVYLIR
jgi:hypothetical protein